MRPGVILLATGFAVLAGCAVGPDYHRPEAVKSGPVPGAFTDQGSPTNGPQWKAAEPSAQLPRGVWWEIFGDAELNRLETLAGADNQDLAASAARFEQARAGVGIARANFFPQLSVQPNLIRQRTSVNAPQLGMAAGASYTYNTYMVPLDLSWELDLWGRVRRQTESARAGFSAAVEDLESVKLALQAEVAADYFTLRALEAERSLVADTVEAYRRSLELTQNRRKGGIVSDLDVSEAETQLRSTDAELPAIDLQRANLLHALATLCGRPATGFQVAGAASITNAVPSLPAGLPSRLLERRPDISAAERRMAASNADVGVARTAFYPEIVFNGMGGFESLNASTVFDWPSRLWAIGPSLNLPLFTGGRNRAQLASARAAYDEAVANYRQIVLIAFEEVEDQLAAQRLLTQELDAESAAFTAASRTLEIANNRYKSGLVTYLEVATAQSAALANERSVVQLQGQRFVAQVALIKALGGGWESDAKQAYRQP
ncbi:MAG: efflux transporter outer membrane subunit [Verrucomicrobiota bacterium]|jgi:multidrug efflux system outer membrane protein